MWGMTDACTYLFATIYFWKINKDWFYFAMVGYCLNLFAAACAWFLPESPRYLLEKGKIEELKESMEVIARVNQKPLRFNQEQFKPKSE